jgi:hypothetical protein
VMNMSAAWSISSSILNSRPSPSRRFLMRSITDGSSSSSSPPMSQRGSSSSWNGERPVLVSASVAVLVDLLEHSRQLGHADCNAVAARPGQRRRCALAVIRRPREDRGAATRRRLVTAAPGRHEHADLARYPGEHRRPEARRAEEEERASLAPQRRRRLADALYLHGRAGLCSLSNDCLT